MQKGNIIFLFWKRIARFAPLIVLSFLVVTILWQTQKPSEPHKRQAAYTSLFFIKEKNTPDEKRIAKHFSVDTLPGLMQKGLIKKYHRNSSGTSLIVCGKLWKERSQYFKTSLLTEVFVHNKVSGYELSAKIIDSVSGKLYAQILPSTKIDLYD
jgi:hypothetical protein